MIDSKTGEQVDVQIKAGGQTVNLTGRQLHMAAEGMGRFEGVGRETVFSESHAINEGAEVLEVTLETCGNARVPVVSVDAPEEMTPREAELLKGMIDRVLKCAKVTKP